MMTINFLFLPLLIIEFLKGSAYVEVNILLLSLFLHLIFREILLIHESWHIRSWDSYIGKKEKTDKFWCPCLSCSRSRVSALAAHYSDLGTPQIQVKVLMSWSHPRLINSIYLRLGSQDRYFKNSPEVIHRCSKD
jgi:hypothetical protein